MEISGFFPKKKQAFLKKALKPLSNKLASKRTYGLASNNKINSPRLTANANNSKVWFCLIQILMPKLTINRPNNIERTK